MGSQIGALHVRRSSLVRATAERVWQEFTSFEQLAAWFGHGHRLEVFEPRLGGQVQLSVETPLADACHVEPFHHGFERLGEHADRELEGYEAGWHSRHLEALKAIVEA